MKVGCPIAPELPARRITLARGEFLFHQGQRCTELFTVSEGVVRLLRPQSDGSTAVMQVARCGDWIAESSLFAARYHCHAVAEIPATLAAVRKAQFLELLQADPARCLKLGALLARELRTLRMQHELLRIRRADERLLAWLRMQPDAPGRHVRIERTWSAIAEELGLSREALYRALAKLRRRRAIRVSPQGVELT